MHRQLAIERPLGVDRAAGGGARIDGLGAQRDDEADRERGEAGGGGQPVAPPPGARRQRGEQLGHGGEPARRFDREAAVQRTADV
ncbi:MAG TPA: hypothetical protein VK607_26660, partial [Kofleriaceae bacterium]|nr:hypothetical protein [Kofleriaceae bacterium]